MALIQNAVCNKEGKKWKQRWAVLKEKVSVGDSVLYLIIYKDASHATAHKQKSAIQLLDFCGLDVLSQHEKFQNVLVIATTTQTHFLSFDSAQICHEWKRLLVSRFGEDTQFAVTIPGKQKLKSGAATLRIYQRFFSIITCKNYVSVGRWYCEDVYRYAALDDSLFSFEIKPAQMRGGSGQQINLAVDEAAEDVVKVFDLIAKEESSKIIAQADFHGSAILEELGRGNRDQNFLQRCLLRVSNRVRKHKRDRTRSDVPPKSRSPVEIDVTSLSPSSSVSVADETKWRSLDRKRNPDISVKLDDVTREQVLSIKSKFYRQKSEGGRLSLEVRASGSSQDGKSSVSSLRKSVNMSEVSIQRSANVDDERRASDHVFAEPKPEPVSKNVIPGQPRSKVMGNASADDVHRDVFAVNDDLVVKSEQKRSVDSLMNTMSQRQSSSEMPRALKARSKPGKKKHKSESDSQPTPPPRSPISLGLAGPVNYFEFPSNDDVKTESCDSASVTTRDSDDVSLSLKAPADGEQENDNLLEQIDAEVRKRALTCDGDDLKVIDEMSCNSADDSDAPPLPAHRKAQRCGSDSALAPRSVKAKFSNAPSEINPEPEYRNIDSVTRLPRLDRGRLPSDEQRPDVRRRISCNRDPNKHSSDPLVLDNWSRATGEGEHVISHQVDELMPTDYVNISGTNRGSDDEHGSYVNVSGSTAMPGRKKNHVPSPLVIKGGHRNDFSKYDDEENAGVYQYFGNSGDFIRASYDGVNGAKSAGNKRFEYHNLMSPKPKSSTGSLNYVEIGSVPSTRSTLVVSSNSSSPVSKSPGKLTQRVNVAAGSDYTMIDKDLTNALQQSKLQLQKQREGSPMPQKGMPVKKAKP